MSNFEVTYRDYVLAEWARDGVWTAFSEKAEDIISAVKSTMSTTGVAFALTASALLSTPAQTWASQESAVPMIAVQLPSAEPLLAMNAISDDAHAVMYRKHLEARYISEAEQIVDLGFIY